jgi:pimeloyl-ACP methyl ester carboxylesterase
MSLPLIAWLTRYPPVLPLLVWGFLGRELPIGTRMSSPDVRCTWYLRASGWTPHLCAQLAAVAAFDASGPPERLGVPALVIHGAADVVVPVECGRRLAHGLVDWCVLLAG